MPTIDNCQKSTARHYVRPKNIWAQYAMPLMCVVALSACGDKNMDVVARMSHDFNGKFELFSYMAKPADSELQAETIAKNQYGKILSDIKSPSTMFTCVWRDTSSTKSDQGQPAEIFLTCNSAISLIETPKSLTAAAELFNKIDRSNLKVSWQLLNGNYQISRFEIEILAKGKVYRSQNLAEDMSQIRVTQSKMIFPQNAHESLAFDLESKLPFRQSSRDKQGDPIVSISVAGTAEPIPTWMNY
jgi:hypothetical protein